MYQQVSAVADGPARRAASPASRAVHRCGRWVWQTGPVSCRTSNGRSSTLPHWVSVHLRRKRSHDRRTVRNYLQVHSLEQSYLLKRYHNFLKTRCTIGWGNRLCQKPVRSVQPFRQNTEQNKHTHAQLHVSYQLATRGLKLTSTLTSSPLTLY